MIAEERIREEVRKKIMQMQADNPEKDEEIKRKEAIFVR